MKIKWNIQAGIKINYKWTVSHLHFRNWTLEIHVEYLNFEPCFALYSPFYWKWHCRPSVRVPTVPLATVLGVVNSSFQTEAETRDSAPAANATSQSAHMQPAPHTVVWLGWETGAVMARLQMLRYADTRDTSTQCAVLLCCCPPGGRASKQPPRCSSRTRIEWWGCRCCSVTDTPCTDTLCPPPSISHITLFVLTLISKDLSELLDCQLQCPENW